MTRTIMGWFYGYKLHLVVSEQDDLLSITLTPGNTDDRKPVEDLLTALGGKVFTGDYSSRDVLDEDKAPQQAGDSPATGRSCEAMCIPYPHIRGNPHKAR